MQVILLGQDNYTVPTPLKKFSDFPSIFAIFSPIEIFSQCGVNFKTNMYGNNYFYTCLK